MEKPGRPQSERSPGCIKTPVAPGILVGVAMLRSPRFPRLAGWAAVVANVLGFGLFLSGIGVLLSILSVVILIAWYAASAWGLLRLRPA